MNNEINTLRSQILLAVISSRGRYRKTSHLPPLGIKSPCSWAEDVARDTEYLAHYALTGEFPLPVDKK